MNEGIVYDAVGVITVGRVGFTETFRNIFSHAARIKHGVQLTNSPYWDQSLTRAIVSALQTPAKYLLFYDGDGAWEDRDLTELYRIIDGDERVDAVFPIQADRFGNRPLVYDWLPQIFGPYDWNQPVLAYPHGHFGLTFIRRRVFEQLPQPWFWSQPAHDGTWDLKPGKMDADTYFWLKLYEHQTGVDLASGRKVRPGTGNVSVLATMTVIGHMEHCIRWQCGKDVIVQTVPEFQQHGKPYGCRAPRPEEYAQPARATAAPDGDATAPEPMPTPQRVNADGTGAAT